MDRLGSFLAIKLRTSRGISGRFGTDLAEAGNSPLGAGLLNAAGWLVPVGR